MNTVIVSTYAAIPGPLDSPTVPILARLPTPPPGERWVGPIRAIVAEYEIEPDAWAGHVLGSELTSCYTPCVPLGCEGDYLPKGCAITNTSGRACARTREGWWVAVPAGRPSSLACQVRSAGGTHEVGPDYTGPIRDEFLEGTGPVWKLGNLTVSHAVDPRNGHPTNRLVVVWCPFPAGSRARFQAAEAAGIRI